MCSLREDGGTGELHVSRRFMNDRVFLRAALARDRLLRNYYLMAVLRSEPKSFNVHFS